MVDHNSKRGMVLVKDDAVEVWSRARRGGKERGTYLSGCNSNQSLETHR